jgi:PAS domain S-box-containing protein
MQPDKTNLESIGLLVADHVPALLAYWDKNMVCQFANDAYRYWFGITREEMIGKITIKELLGPIYEKNLPYILQVLEGKPQIFEREFLIPDGSTKHSVISYFPDFSNGQVKGFFVHGADVTYLKLLEKKLTESNKIISDQNNRLLNFANIVSHNLKSYAGNLKSILELFIRAESEEEKKVTLQYLQNISKGFSTTVDNLNEIAQVQSQSELKLVQVNIHQCAAQAIEVLKVQIDSTHSVIHNKVDQNLTTLANPAYMDSILLNLLSNTIKYRRPDQTLVVEIKTEVKNNELQLTVKDNGRGINLEQHKNDIFGLYKTFHGNPEAKGVGLFITKWQIEAMNGRIEVTSEENKGTSFTVYFPILNK